ncbi:hypothetical protein L6452_01038 [Arctium lappa]|uniref:Uncharacterized protein n=1 Tax=Arctium lappa TaxID=4217 RepID=A0ACB9FFP0_ARCLA|nr:hypothetical protein L6452_01038 [Arctium lappa]
MGDTRLGVKPDSRSKPASSQGEARSCLGLEPESTLTEAHIEVSETRGSRARLVAQIGPVEPWETPSPPPSPLIKRSSSSDGFRTKHQHLGDSLSQMK